MSIGPLFVTRAQNGVVDVGLIVGRWMAHAMMHDGKVSFSWGPWPPSRGSKGSS